MQPQTINIPMVREPTQTATQTTSFVVGHECNNLYTHHHVLWSRSVAGSASTIHYPSEGETPLLILRAHTSASEQPFTLLQE